MHCLNLNEFITRQHNDVGAGYPKRFADVLAAIPSLSFNNGPWLAGGALRRLFDGNDKESDFDIFFVNEQQLLEYRVELQKRGAVILYDNELNITMNLRMEDGPFARIQLIKFYFSSPDLVLDWFDYTNCQFISDGITLMHGQYTLYDIGSKHLRIHNIHHAASTVRRMLKYARQGYTICDGTINDILTAVSRDPSLINEQVKYID